MSRARRADLPGAPAPDVATSPRATARRRALQNALWQRLLDLAEARPTRRLVRRTGRLLARAHRARVALGDRLATLSRRLIRRG